MSNLKPNSDYSKQPADCEEAQSLVASYSIGATTVEEARLVESALEICPEIAAELQDFMAISEALLHIVPQKEEPPSAKVLLRNLPEQKSASRASVKEPIQLQQPAASLQRSNRIWILLSAASIILATALVVTITLYWSNEINKLREEQQSLETRLTEQFAVLTSVGAGNAIHTQLVATADSPTDKAFATVVMNPDQGIGSLYVSGMPALDPDMAYQLWFVRGDHTFNAGSFRVDSTGSGTLIFHLTEPIQSFQAMGISAEPASGSDTPTHPHLVIGQI